MDNIKKFAKPSLKLDKTIISKGKSSKIIKKYFTNDKVWWINKYIKESHSRELIFINFYAILG